MDKEKALEYQQVAALVCQLVDDLEEMIKDESLTADQVKEYVTYIKGEKDTIINDPKQRAMRYNAMCLIFHYLKPSAAEKPNLVKKILDYFI